MPVKVFRNSLILPALILSIIMAAATEAQFVPGRRSRSDDKSNGFKDNPRMLLAFRDVVATQLGRIPASGRVPLPERLGDMTGVSSLGGGDTAAIAAALVLAGIVVAAFVVPRRRPSTFEWFVLGSAAAVAVAQVGPAWYYQQYAAFFAPFLALVLGISLARLLGERSRATVAVAAAAVVVLLASQLALIHRESVPDVATTVDAVVPVGGCTLSDGPKLVVTTNRFVAAAPGCTTMTDPQGATLAFANDRAASLAMWWSAFTPTMS